MISHRYILATLIQSTGPLSFLALSLTIARSEGAAIQGNFASTKALIDLVAAVALFGLPQSIVLAINRHNTSRHTLFRWATFYTLGCLVVGLLTMLVSSKISPAASAMPLVVTASIWVLLGMWRAILLTVDDGMPFNVVTVTPTLSLAILGFISLYAAEGFASKIPMIYLAGGLVALLICFPLVSGRISRSTRAQPPPSMRQLVSDGLDVFALTVCSSLQVYICFEGMEAAAGHLAVGHMSIALLILNALSFPLQSVSPMLLNRWSKLASSEALSSGRKQVRSVAALLFVASLVSIAGAIASAPLWFKPSELPPPGMWLLLLCVAPAFLARTAALRLAAIGKLRYNSLVAITQVCVFALTFGGLVLFGAMAAHLSAAIAWLAAEVGAALLLTRRLNAIEQSDVEDFSLRSS